jgi:uncharacterized protein YjcR
MSNALYSPAVKQEALELYIQGSPLPAIAKKLGLPYGTVHGWHTAEKWASMRKQMRADLLEDFREKFRAGALVSMYRTIMRQLNLSNKVAGRIEAALPAATSSDDLLKLAQAMAAEFKVVERLLKPLVEEPRSQGRTLIVPGAQGFLASP